MLRGQFENQFGSDGNRRLQAAIHGALVCEESVDAAGRLPVPFLGLQPQFGVDAADHQDVVFRLDFAHGLGNQPRVRRINVTRFQRASEGAGESTGGGGDNVIERRRVRFEHFGRHLIMLGYRAMHAESHRCGFGRQPGPAQRASDALNPDMRTIGHFRHESPDVTLYRSAVRRGPRNLLK